VSHLIGAPLREERGVRLGTVRDVVVRLDASVPWPEVVGLIARSGRHELFVPYAEVVRFDPSAVSLREPLAALASFIHNDNQLRLYADVLDRQMLDVGGRRLVRVDDLQLLAENGRLWLAGIESGVRPLLRRLAPRALARQLLPGMVLDWGTAEYLAGPLPVVRLQLPRDRVARLRPEQIAEVLACLAYTEARTMLGALAPDVAADAVEQLPLARQACLFSGIQLGPGGAILEAMTPPAAADLVGALDSGQRERLLRGLPERIAGALREILAKRAIASLQPGRSLRAESRAEGRVGGK
jgi:hypothetical protein